MKRTTLQLFLETLWQDLRHGARGLRRSPAFTVAAVATLTLGVGATAAIFSVAHAVVFKPLPYGDIDRRVMIWSQWRGFDKTWVSEAELFDYDRSARQRGRLGHGQANHSGGDPLRIGVGQSTLIFETLGVSSHWAGFNKRNTGHSVAIAGSATALRRRPSVLEEPPPRRRVALIVGVMPLEFQLPTDTRGCRADRAGAHINM
jgi:hypothetical protein